MMRCRSSPAGWRLIARPILLRDSERATLNRLVGAANYLWSGTYTYDGFGNLTAKTGSGGSPNAFPSMTATYNSKNQLTTASYDANGNTISSGGNSLGYTAENKLKLQQSTAWPFPWTLYGSDPGGHRVMKETNPDPYNDDGQYNPLWEFYFYTLGGQKLVTIDCNNANAQYQPSCWVVGENVYFGERLLASNGVYVATDRLGTVRANTQGEKFNYYPYGEERSSTVDGREKFGTYFRDGVGQDYAEQRYYNSGMGRFGSVDRGPANLGNSASWNRYTYVKGDPVNRNDPTGLDDAGIMSTPDPPSDGPPASVAALCVGMLGGQWYQWQLTNPDAGGFASAQMACENMGSSLSGVMSGVPDIGGGSQPSIAAARAQVVNLLENNPKCASAIGARSDDEAVSRAKSIGISYGVVTVGGTVAPNYLVANAAGTGLAPGQYAGGYNTQTGDITLNQAVNWSDPRSPDRDHARRPSSNGRRWRPGYGSHSPTAHRFHYPPRTRP